MEHTPEGPREPQTLQKNPAGKTKLHKNTLCLFIHSWCKYPHSLPYEEQSEARVSGFLLSLERALPNRAEADWRSPPSLAEPRWAATLLNRHLSFGWFLIIWYVWLRFDFFAGPSD